MKRRRFLESTLAGIGGLIVGCDGDNRAAVAEPATPAALTPDQPLRPFRMLENESADPQQFAAVLRAAPATAVLEEGTATPMWLYNGIAPGPMIELREGQHVRIRLDNELPEDTTIHWHGLPVPPEQDGNPMDPVPPGTSRYYEYELPYGSAGTYWYHPHPHDRTAAQVVFGLAAPLLVRAADDPLANLAEVTLFITGMRLEGDAQLSTNTGLDWTIGRQGEALIVNGARLPRHTVRPGTTQRWRIVNATNARHFRLALDGHTLTLVGTDGGLLGAPVAGLT